MKKFEESNLSIIWEALKAGENDTVIALLEGVDVKAVVDSSKKTLLHLSAANGNAFITNHLVNCGCAIDANDDSEITPLMLAIYYRHLEVIKILIDAGADLCSVNSYGRSPVFYAKLQNDPKIGKIIKSAIKDKKAMRYKVMKLFMDTTYYKSRTDDIQDLYRDDQMDYSLRFLKSDYYNIGECSSERVPLISAVFLRDVHQLRMNLNYQVSANIHDGNGWTALHAVATIHSIYFNRSLDAYNKLSEIVQMLVDHGADLNAKDNKGATPLHVAAAFGHADVCNWLLQQGADVNARDNEGRTPLHVAFIKSADYYGTNKTIELLLKNGADAFAISSEGKTVLELTEKLSGVSIRNFILKNLAVSRYMEKPVDDKHLEVLRTNPIMQSYYQRCELELRRAKQDRIINNVTLIDMLTKSTRALATCVKNKDFRRILKSLECRDRYPIFAKQIQRRFDKADNRMKMTNQAAVILCAALPYFDPSHLVLEHLLNYLTCDDLRTLTVNCVDNHRLN